jgi:hypothetical protein
MFLVQKFSCPIATHGHATYISPTTKKKESKITVSCNNSRSVGPLLPLGYRDISCIAHTVGLIMPHRLCPRASPLPTGHSLGIASLIV